MKIQPTATETSLFIVNYVPETNFPSDATYANYLCVYIRQSGQYVYLI